MPGLDGYGLVEKFRENDGFKDTPLIAISATPDEERARAAGFDQFFVKPVRAEKVVEVLRNLTHGVLV